MDVSPLVETLKKQDEILSELRDVLVRQREALREGRQSDLQGLMGDLRNAATRAQAVEIKRGRLAEVVAGELGCPPRISEILSRLSAEEGARVSSAGDALRRTVGKLRAEMDLFRVLLDEAKMVNELVITEWRRFYEEGPLGPLGIMGGFDARI